MAYFAEINNNNVVTNVYKVRNELIIENNQESEQKGINHLKKILGQNKNFIKTSYNTKNGIYFEERNGEYVPAVDQSKSFRKNFAEVGSIWDANRDGFYLPSPYPSWVFDEVKFTYVPPIAYPTSTENEYAWDEVNQNWTII